jgi:hypothetical protein
VSYDDDIELRLRIFSGQRRGSKKKTEGEKTGREAFDGVSPFSPGIGHDATPFL